VWAFSDQWRGEIDDAENADRIARSHQRHRDSLRGLIFCGETIEVKAKRRGLSRNQARVFESLTGPRNILEMVAALYAIPEAAGARTH
jgi:hypothetical protein